MPHVCKVLRQTRKNTLRNRGRKQLKTVLFACVENSFRSQIAEAYFTKFAPKDWTAISAGLKPAEEVHPNAIQLMKEEGIDISHKKPQALTTELQLKADIGVIVCGSAECPVVYAKYAEEWGVPNPAKMSLDDARRVRDTIKNKVLKLIETIQKSF
jgi:protein-tyrosine-phosphatase